MRDCFKMSLSCKMKNIHSNKNWLPKNSQTSWLVLNGLAVSSLHCNLAIFAVVLCFFAVWHLYVLTHLWTKSLWLFVTLLLYQVEIILNFRTVVEPRPKDILSKNLPFLADTWPSSASFAKRDPNLLLQAFPWLVLGFFQLRCLLLPRPDYNP